MTVLVKHILFSGGIPYKYGLLHVSFSVHPQHTAQDCRRTVIYFNVGLLAAVMFLSPVYL